MCFFFSFCNKILRVFMNSKYCIYSHRRKEIEHKMFNIQILTAWHFLAHALNISHKEAHAAVTLVLGCLLENWSRAFQAQAQKIFQFPISYWQSEVKCQCDNPEDMTGTHCRMMEPAECWLLQRYRGRAVHCSEAWLLLLLICIWMRDARRKPYIFQPSV